MTKYIYILKNIQSLRSIFKIITSYSYYKNKKKSLFSLVLLPETHETNAATITELIVIDHQTGSRLLMLITL